MNKLFLNGVYQAKMSNLLSKDTFENLKALSGNAFLNYLKELSFGANSNYEHLEDVFKYENKALKTEVNSLSETNIFSDIFYLKNDLTNIKIVYKSIYYDVLIDDYDQNSKFSIDALTEFFKRDNDALIKDSDLEVLKTIKNIKANSLKKSLEEIEKTYYLHYLNKAKAFDKSLYNYLAFKVVINNLLVFLKLKARNASLDLLKSLLLPEDFIGIDMWLELFVANEQQITNFFTNNFYGQLLPGISEYFDNGSVKLIKENLNNYFKNLLLELSYDNNTLGSVTYYLYLKEVEINNVRRSYYE